MALRGLATIVVVALGFSAVSDDDFARVSISQSFAESPRVDPSGTSWLPFPFWLHGSSMLLFGPSFEVARAVSILTSLLSAGMIYIAARWLTFGRKPALLAGSLAAVLPHAVWLGYATVPEGFSAALCILALSSLVADDRDPRAFAAKRLIGGLCLSLATLSRYEAWPIAVFFCLFVLGGILFPSLRRRPQKLTHWLPLLLAASGPISWLLHGVFIHGDASFFVKRVADYRQAVGQSAEDFWQVLSHYPLVLLRAEPELMSLLLLALVPGVSPASTYYKRTTWVMVAGLLTMLALLIYGDLRDGAPTHHAERPLLAIWLGVCLAGGALLHAAWQRRRRWLFGSAAIAVLLMSYRSWFTQRDSFINRDAELAAGAMARRHAPTGKLLIDSADFGFFASMVGFRSPSRAAALMERDPRRPEADPWESPMALREAVDRKSGDWLLVRETQLDSARFVGEVVDESPGFVLLKVAR